MSEALLNARSEPAMLCTPDGTLLTVNDACARRHGRLREELVGANLFELLPPEVAAYSRRWIHSAIETGEPVHFEDGHAGRILETRVYPIIDTNAATAKLAIYTTDVTERRRMDAQLDEQQRALATVQRLGSVGTWKAVIEESEEDNTVWSDELYRILGLNPSEHEASFDAFLRTVHPDDRTGLLAAREQVLQQGGELQRELRLCRPDGEVRIGLLHARYERRQGDTERYVQGIVKDVTDVKLSEQALARVQAEQRENEARLRGLFEHIPVGVLELDISKLAAELTSDARGDFASYFEAHPDVALDHLKRVRLLDANPGALEVFGARDKSELIGVLTSLFPPDALQKFGASLTAMLGGQTVGEDESEVQNVNDERRHVAFRWCVVPGHERTLSRVLLSLTDITTHRRLEQQLRQAQKMEAVGRLAGGIAHDFNNLLTGINGYARLLLEQLDLMDSRREAVQEVLRAGTRAAELVQQLLAYSSRQIIRPGPVDLNLVVQNCQVLLRRLIGEHVRLKADLSPLLPPALADHTQLEQIVMNLVLNARDALQRGGTIEVRTATAQRPAREDADRESTDERCVVLSVTDTGQGIEKGVMSKIFDPFFSTKEDAGGNGLGLSTVYGIVQQSGGSIEVQSEIGVGSTFTVYLPVATERITSAGSERPSAVPALEPLTILLVEDEPVVRHYGQRILENEGHQVLVASHPTEAIQLAEAYSASIDLLLTDVVMPDMSGLELVQELRARGLELKALYMSGYTRDIVARQGVVEADAQLVTKPFDRATLVRAIARALEVP